MTDLAQHGTDYGVVEKESTSIVERNLAIGSRLWASSLVFFFFAFLFAYFYLRSLNENGRFKPKGVHAPQGWGIAIVICLVLSAALLRLGSADQRADRLPQENYLFEHPQIGRFELFIVPVISRDPTRHKYEVVFNRPPVI